jgi:SAM-dependent methyltransferase
MSYPELLAKTRELVTAAQTMGVIGAELRLRQMGQNGHPRIRGALHAVLTNLEPDLLDGLDPGQIAAVVGHLSYALQEALDLIREPERAPGWGYTDPAILQERGRGSHAAARNFANLIRQRPALAALLDNCRFLDIGTGVGWLAIEAAKLWPGMQVVGLDTWEPSLRLAAANIAAEGLNDRVTLRRQSVLDPLVELLRLKDFFDPDGVAIGPIPKGTPVSLLGNIDLDERAGPLENFEYKLNLVKLLLKLKADLKALPKNASGDDARKTFSNVVDDLLAFSKCPDFIVNRGHYFGTDYFKEEPGLSDSDKRALIAFLKTF